MFQNQRLVIEANYSVDKQNHDDDDGIQLQI